MQTLMVSDWLWLEAAVPVPEGHGTSKISHSGSSPHCNITHWIHMEEMKWFSSAMLGVLAVNFVGFGWALA
jgi:hypothetical protein